MKLISPPFRAANLTAWFIAAEGRAEAPAIPDYLTLEEALEEVEQILHETGDVNELLVENPTDRDLFIQAGDIVKGGRQDRSLGTDFIVPARSGKIPIPAFCVESGRWGDRPGDSAAFFGKSTDYVSSKALKTALRSKKSQGAVWEAVSEVQLKLSQSVGASVASAASPTSLQLAYENPDLGKTVKDYLDLLPGAVPDGAAGVVWGINGALSHADLYASPDLFARLWKKLRRAAALEALSERLAAASKPASKESPQAISDETSILEWFERSREAEPEEESLPPRTRLANRMNAAALRFETYDTAATPMIHLSLLTKGAA